MKYIICIRDTEVSRSPEEPAFQYVQVGEGVTDTANIATRFAGKQEALAYLDQYPDMKPLASLVPVGN
jgi:hypothetical protein